MVGGFARGHTSTLKFVVDGRWAFMARCPGRKMDREKREREVTFAGVPTLLVLRKTISYLSTKSPDLSN